LEIEITAINLQKTAPASQLEQFYPPSREVINRGAKINMEYIILGKRSWPKDLYLP